MVFNSTRSLSIRSAALKWALGCKIADTPYVCQWCNKQADGQGLHSVTCQLSGAIGRGHTSLKHTVYKLARSAGLDVQLEVPLPNHPQLIPADLLIKSWEGSQNLALDFTIVSPSLRISEGNIANLETITFRPSSSNET